MVDVNFNANLFNPVFWHIWHYLHQPKIRKILVRGGSSAGKTFSLCDAINLHQLEVVRNCLAIRKHRVHVETTIKKSFEASINRFEATGLSRYFQKMDGEVRVATGALTTYAGMDDSEKIKGLESYDYVYINELNQLLSGEWDEINRRLRGRPGQKILADWNPIISTHWINKEILDPSEGWEEMPLFLPEIEREFQAFTQLTPGYAFVRMNAAGDTVWINVTYRDNFWVVGHPGNTEPATPGHTAYRDADPNRPEVLQPGMFVAPDGNLYGYLDVHTLANFAKMKAKKPNDYRIYGLGEDGLIRTGGEFWPSFDESVHVTDRVKYNPIYPLHIILDNNVDPYITIAIWQVVGWEIRQVWELPCEAPENTAFKAAKALDKWLLSVGNNLTVYIYGDPSANARSTEDDEGRSFFDKFIGTLEVCGWRIEKRVGKSPPGVALSGEFVNDIYDRLFVNWQLLINIACRVSIEDYSLVKKAPDGTMLKEKTPDPKDPTGKRRIEKYGHFSDTKRYFLTTLLADLFTEYKNRQRQPRIQAVQQ
jgi:phage terminase large subunit